MDTAFLRFSQTFRHQEMADFGMGKSLIVDRGMEHGGIPKGPYFYGAKEPGPWLRREWPPPALWFDLKIGGCDNDHLSGTIEKSYPCGPFRTLPAARDLTRRSNPFVLIKRCIHIRGP